MPVSSPIISWLLAYRYPIAYPLALFEGPIVMMVSGFLVRTGFFAFWPIYVVLIAGDLTGDVLWYFVGRYGGRPFLLKYGYFLNVTPENVERAESFFHAHQGKILFISKLTTGFGFAIATLIAAGAARVPFKKYFFINFGGEFIWCGLLMAVGYFLGHLYTYVDKGLQWMFISAIIVIGGFAVWGFSKAMRKRFGTPPEFDVKKNSL